MEMGLLGYDYLCRHMCYVNSVNSARDIQVRLMSSSSLIWSLTVSSYRPIILVERAKQLRRDTGDNRYYAPLEKGRKSLKDTAIGVITRPFLVFSREPMLIALTLYMSVRYVLLYVLLEAGSNNFW